MSWLPMRGAHFGMKWFRSNIRYGSRFALFALVVQFVLSFGHFHGLAAQAAPAIVSVQQQQAPDNDSGHHPGDICAICAVMSLANTVMFATPPLLSLPQVAEFLYQTTEAEFVHLRSARIAFQPRAPPIS